MSALGGLVKRQNSTPGVKLGSFLKSRPTVFRFVGDQVELVNK
jgi:hypothetical protein